MAASWAAALDLKRIQRNAMVAALDIGLMQAVLATNHEGPKGTDTDLSNNQKEELARAQAMLRGAADDLDRWCA